MIKKCFTVLLVLSVLTTSVWAIMPPSVYQERILKSPIKATAEVISVKVIRTEATWVQKLVWFKVIDNYGTENAGEKFAAYCYSQGEQHIVGGKIYYYPQPGEKVYVTAMGKNLEITSYTKLTDKLEAALKNTPEKVKPGIGVVHVE